MENENTVIEPEYTDIPESAVSPDGTPLNEPSLSGPLPAGVLPDNAEYMPSDASGLDSSSLGQTAPSGDISQELTDRLDALISILTPEDAADEGVDVEAAPLLSPESISGYPEDSGISAASDSANQELLSSINETLALIKSENVSYHAEMLVAYEDIHLELQHISCFLEQMFVLLVIIGMSIGFQAGCKLTDCFFKKMRG